MKPSPTVCKNRMYRRWAALDWLSPAMPLPHGLSGILVVVLGLFFLSQALLVGPNTGWGYDVNGPRPKVLFYIFVAAIFENTIAGLLLVKKKAPTPAHLPFYLGGIAQIALAWFALRFSLEITRDFYSIGLVLDRIFGGILLLVIFISVGTVARSAPLFLQPLFIVGILSMSLTFMYPFQLAWLGNEWFACTLDRYPYQKAGFVSYIYVPTLFANACIFFGATLYNRKILPQGKAAMFFFLFVTGTMVSTVLAQEIYISEVSTQQLIILCDTQENSPFLSQAARLLDTSTLARNVLQILGIGLRTPPEY